MEEELKDDLRNVVRGLRDQRGLCPASEALVTYQEMDPISRRGDTIHDHVQLCSRCQLVLHHLSEPEQKRRSGWPLILVPATVVLLLFIFLPRYGGRTVVPTNDTIRGTEIQLVRPAGTMDTVSEFRWQSPIQVRQYRVRIYKGATETWSGISFGTRMAFPFSLQLDRGTEYSWQVEALDPDGTVRMTSPRQPFSIP